MVATPDTGAGTPSLTTVFDSITTRRRRIIVATLLDRSEPISVDELAAAVVAVERDRSAAGVTPADCEPVRAELRHCDLPKLAEAGLIERTDDGVVSVADHYFRALRLEHALVSWLDDEPDGLDELFDALADHRRRVVLSVVRDPEDAISIERLAERVADRAGEPVERTLLSLRNSHLPKLSDAGLIERDDDHVIYVGRPLLRAGWIDIDRSDRTADGTIELTPGYDHVASPWTVDGADT